MKKTAFFLFGLITLSAGAGMFYSNASSTAYHEYLRAQSFSGRSAGQNSTIEAQLSAASNYRETRHFHRLNYMFPTHNKREHYSQVSATAEQFTDRPIKTTTVRRGAFQQSNKATPSLSTRVVTIRSQFKEAKTDSFSVQVPSSWSVKANAHMLVTDTNSDIIFRAEKLAGISCKNVLSFEICGRNIIQTQNRQKEKEMLLTTSKIVNTVANIFDNQLGDRATYDFFEQTQIANYGRTEFIIMNRIVESRIGELYLLEIIAPKTNASYAVSLTKRIFDTFRIK
jgi:hypothetical protein